MEFHEIEMTGSFWVERASLPSWTAADVGRIIYSTDDNSIYYGSNTEWVCLPIYLFKTIAVSGQTSINASTSTDTLTFSGSNGISIETNATGKEVLISAGNSFGTISASGVDLNATIASDTLTLSGDNGLDIDIDSVSKTITFIGSNAFSTVETDNLSMDALTFSDTFELVGGNGIELTPTWSENGGVGTASISIASTAYDIVSSFFSSGRKLWIYENSAPTGWTILTSCADGLLAVKGGTNAYNVTGGNQAGTWTQPTHTHTLGNTALTESQIPSHYHFIATNESMLNKNTGAVVQLTNSNSVPFYTNYTTGTVDNGYLFFGGSVGVQPTIGRSSATGSGTAHGHSVTSVSTANTWRPKAYVGIIIQKS